MSFVTIMSHLILLQHELIYTDGDDDEIFFFPISGFVLLSIESETCKNLPIRTSFRKKCTVFIGNLKLNLS